MPHDNMEIFGALTSTNTEQQKAICLAELTLFNATEQEWLLPVLWHYIKTNKDSNDPDKITAVCAAIRKYVALMPTDKIGELEELIDPQSLQLEPLIEIGKMIYRNHQFMPPNINQKLAEKLWKVCDANLNRSHLWYKESKYATVALVMLQSLIAIKSPLAKQAFESAQQTYPWFIELIEDWKSKQNLNI